MQPLAAVANAARIVFTFALLSAALVVVSLMGVTWWAASAVGQAIVRALTGPAEVRPARTGAPASVKALGQPHHNAYLQR